MPDKIERLSSMQEGVYCALRINNKVTYRRVSEKNGKLFIVNNKKRIFEQDLPLGEEVIIK